MENNPTLPSKEPKPLVNMPEVVVASMGVYEGFIKELTEAILRDYCKRFRKRIKKKVRVAIALINQSVNSEAPMGITITDGGNVMVQIEDPYLEDDTPKHPYIERHFGIVLCHELTHVCQFLTGSAGATYCKIKFDEKEQLEKYYFDPQEMEARILEMFYWNAYALPMWIKAEAELFDSLKKLAEEEAAAKAARPKRKRKPKPQPVTEEVNPDGNDLRPGD
jgi:hypothetical protein